MNKPSKAAQPPASSNASKHININISYNLTQPSVPTHHFSKLQGKKIDNQPVITVRQSDAVCTPKPSFSKRQQTKPAEECLISVNINNHKYTVVNNHGTTRRASHFPSSKLFEPQSYNPSREVSPSRPYSKTKQRKLSTQRATNNKTEACPQPVQPKKTTTTKNTSSKNQKQRQFTKLYTEANTTNALIRKLNKTLGISPANSRPVTDYTTLVTNDQRKSKSPIQSKPVHKQKPIPLDVLINRRLMRISQLSCGGDSEMQQQSIEGYTESQADVEKKVRAVDKIKKCWRNYKRKQINKLYEGVFDHKLSYMVNREYISQGSSEFNSSSRQRESLPTVPNLAIRLPPEDRTQQPQVRIATVSQALEEEDSRFNTHKYMTSDEQPDTPAPKPKPDPSSESSSAEENKLTAQIEQWNKLGKWMTTTINNTAADQTDFDTLLTHIIEQGTTNQKWLEDNFSSSSHVKRHSSSQLSDSQQRIQTLITQQNIAEKAFHPGNDLVFLEARMAIKNHKKSKSACSASQSDLYQSVEKQADTIQNYLDCKLNDFQFKNNSPSRSHQDLLSASKNQRLQMHNEERKRPQRQNCFEQEEINTLLRKLRLNSASDESDSESGGLGQRTSNVVIKQPTKQILPQFINSDKLEQNSFSPTVQLQFYGVEKGAILVDFIIQNVVTQFCENILSSPAIIRHFLGPPLPLVQEQQILGPPKLAYIKTGFHSIKDYLQGLVTFCHSRPDVMQAIIRNSNKSLGATSKEFLFYLRPNSEDISYQPDESEETADLLIVPMQVYDDYESILSHGAHYQSTETTYWTYYWHRAIFEAFNDAFEFQRPYGNQNPPFLWSKSNRLPRPPSTQSNIGSRLRESLQLTLEWCSYPRGIIFDKPDSIFAGAHIKEEEKRRLNQQRMALVLGEDLLDQEKEMLDYEQEESEVRIELSYHVFDQLLFQAAIDLRRLYRLRSLLF